MTHELGYRYLTCEQEHEHEVMTSNLQVWCDRLLGLTFEVRQARPARISKFTLCRTLSLNSESSNLLWDLL